MTNILEFCRAGAAKAPWHYPRYGPGFDVVKWSFTRYSQAVFMSGKRPLLDRLVATGDLPHFFYAAYRPESKQMTDENF